MVECKFRRKTVKEKLDEMSDENSGPTKKHITTACTCCRRRKVKCDGVAPTCSNCRLYKQECKYNYGEDRRKISPKKQIQKLSTRVKQLEALLHSNGIAVPPDLNNTSPPSQALSNPPFDEGNSPTQYGHHSHSDFALDGNARMNGNGNELTNLLPTVDWMKGFETEFPASRPLLRASQEAQNIFISYNEDEQIPLTTNESQAMSGLEGCSPDAAAVVFDDDDALHQGSMLDPATLKRRAHNREQQLRRQSSIEWHNDNSWSNHHHAHSTMNSSGSPNQKDQIAAVELEQSTDMIEQLSARLGSFQIAEDGQLRYFGATSNLHILHNGAFSLSRTPTRSIRREGNIALKRAELDLEINAEFERHLEKLYFTWEDPAIHVVDEDMYFKEQAKYESGLDGTPFYSETLKNAILAVGANLTTRTRQGLPEPVPEFFSARAKALLDIEMDSPTVATVQALVIMSASEAAFTRDARGWIYSGMAVRLSADLGLHLDLSSHVEDGRLTATELDVRRTTFWGVFVHDNMWSLYVGRPWGINIRDISISRPPKAKDKAKNRQWKVCFDTSGVPDTNEIGLFDPVEACADANISLCEMMRRLSRTLYAGRCLSDSELQLFASDMRREFAHWLSSLPPELAVSPAEDVEKVYLPHILQLHMQFYAVSIFLHRPFFSHRNGNYNRAAQRSCVEAAQAMVSILRLYRKQHTLRQTNIQIVHLLFTAALIHVYNTCSTDIREGLGGHEEKEKAMEDLQFCCTALGEIGVAWRSATRALEVIICIKREWQNNAARAARSKRRNDAAEESESLMRKRRATAEQQQEKMEEEMRRGVVNKMQEQNEWQFLDTNGTQEFGLGMNMNMNMNINGLEDSFPMMGAFPDGFFANGFLNAGVLETEKGEKL